MMVVLSELREEVPSSEVVVVVAAAVNAIVVFRRRRRWNYSECPPFWDIDHNPLPQQHEK